MMTTGGYCCDRGSDSLIAEFAPKKSKLATTNGPFAVGDGIRMARAIGVQLIHMDKVGKKRVEKDQEEWITNYPPSFLVLDPSPPNRTGRPQGSPQSSQVLGPGGSSWVRWDPFECQGRKICQ